MLDRGRIAARGTPAELKRLVGGKVVTATVPTAHVDRLPTRPELERPAGVGHVTVRFGTGDADVATELVTRLAQAGVVVRDLDVMSPSLDDVFTHLSTSNDHGPPFRPPACRRAADRAGRPQSAHHHPSPAAADVLPLPGVARTINEMVFAVGRAAILIAGAALLGFRFHGDVVDAAAGLGVLVVLAGAMSALFGRIGDRLRRPDVVQFAGMMVMMPFMFISGAFAPLDKMPGWIGALAALNSVAHAADALRGNVLGTANLGDTIAALAAATSLWAAAATPPIKRRRATGVPATT